MPGQVVPAKILIVDDMPAVREALRWALGDVPELTIVGEAGNGQQALAQASQLEPDVVILDVELPGLDGYAVAQSLKQFPRPPFVIFLTVHSDPASRQRSFEAGGDAFVEKGTGWPVLISQIRRSLARDTRSD
ncbi:MAG TPA: response regulator transcription factor [Anaerolineae bacterium]|jgi:two-component system response regulator AlgR